METKSQMINRIAELAKENTELKAENERLKEKIKMYKSEDTRKHNIIMETLQHEKKALDVSIKYKQTLQEIKEIAKTGMHCEGMGCDFMPKILNLITKAEEVR